MDLSHSFTWTTLYL